MSGVLCFVSQDGPFADDAAENEVSFSSQEDANATFVYRNEQELDQIASRMDQSTLQNSQNMARATTQSASSMPTGGGIPIPHIQETLKPTHLGIGPFWMFLGRVFNSTIFSMVLIGVTVSVSLALGGISVFVVKPSPYFDKSLDAFQIPNHVSTERLDAFNLAKEDSYLRRIMKRSTTSDDNEVDAKKYLTERDDAILNNDAINYDEIQHIRDTNLLGNNKYNNKLFKNYENIVNAPPVNGIHDMEKGVPKSQPLSRHRRSIPIRRYRTTSWKFQLVYIAQGKGDPNIFTKERLETIHDVEMSIMNHEGFTRFCARNPDSYRDPALDVYNYCLPPNSLMTYFYPSKVGNKIKYDGVGSEQADINGTLSWAMQHESFYWFVDTSMNSTNRKSSFIRSEVYFGKPIDESTSLDAHEQFQEYKKFIETYVKLLEKKSTSEVLVLYGGTEIFDYEVSTTIHHDLMLAIPCIISITILLFILTSFSIWLTICGFVSILLSFAWAYFVFHVLCGIDALGLLNLVSAFVVIGIGVDDVFVFVNTFRQADHIYDSKLRMAYTVKTAGTATFFTSVTTAGAFAANMASQ
ncbi:protein dispatched homolog 3-like, partial [Amphiura filiformis]|uniref:protein dispatched homolog 3-like n=1 Tax=Amphiura filiformis TaxID=82378 RepID=UPI003B216061